MNVSSFNHGFEHGVSIKNIPFDIRSNTLSETFWVDSVNGSDANSGTSKRPFATLAYAVTRCTANRGDKIYLCAGHDEDVIGAAGIDLNIAGIVVEFLGEGANRAVLNFTTAPTASLTVTAANITIINPRFVAGIDALTGPVAVQAANCKIYNAEYYDTTAIQTTDALVANGSASGIEIHGWKYFTGSAGTQKQSNIQISAAVSNVVLEDVDILGDFGTYPIEMTAGAITNLRIVDCDIKSVNAGPIPGIGLHASSTGWAKHVLVRIASGTTYVSSLAQLNWENDCEGFNANGGGGDPIGSVLASGIEGKIDAIQADVGDPSARANHQTLEAMIGVPDVASSNLDDMLRTGFDSTAIARNVDGSVMERLEDIKQDLSGSAGIAAFPSAAAPANGVSIAAALRAVYNLALASTSLTFTGSCDAGMVASTTALVSAELAGYGDDFFNTKYYIQVIKNSNAVGTAPETEVRQVTDYVSTTGTFTTVAFSVNVETADELLVLHESLVVLGRDDANNTIATTNVVADANGSLLERDQFNQEAIAVIDGLHDVPLADAAGNAQVRDVIGNKTDAAAAGAVSATESLMAYAKQTVTEGIARDAAIVVIDGFQDVPVADVVTNAQARDVIGNKTDAAAAGAVSATESLMAYAKQNVTNTEAAATSLTTIDGFHDVPGADVVTNAQMRDVIGNKTDAAAAGAVSATESLMAYAKQNVTNTEAIATDTSYIADASLPANPTANSLAAFIASGGTALGAELADSKSIINAIGSDGTTLLYGSGSMLGAIGTEFWVKKSILAANIDVATATNLTTISSGGELSVEDVIVKNDVTGVATSTNINILSDNTDGAPIIWAEAIANLGPNTTVDLHKATVRGVRTILEEGKRIKIQATGLDATGGTVYVYIKFKRLAAGAIVSAL